MNEEPVHNRLDQRLKEHYPDLSRAYIAKLISAGQATVNGIVVIKPRQAVTDSDKIKLNVPAVSEPEDVEIPVIYEDDNLVVIDKPAGLLSHSKGGFNPEPTVATWLNSRLDKNSGSNRDGIVHRLDRGTSGVMVVAKNPETGLFLQKQFSSRKVKKTYVALIEGELSPVEAVIDLPIERNPKKPQSFRVGANGKPAQTTYKILNTIENNSLIELKPKTGRTHQLRVHLKHLGHPILGDDFYGGKLADRLYLHAHKLEFTLPGGERREFISATPKEFNKSMFKNDN